MELFASFTIVESQRFLDGTIAIKSFALYIYNKCTSKSYYQAIKYKHFTFSLWMPFHKKYILKIYLGIQLMIWSWGKIKSEIYIQDNIDTT